MKKNLIIYGVGKFAEYVGYVFEKDSDYEVTAYCVEKDYLNSNKFLGKLLFSFEELETRFPPSENVLFIAVGNNKIREGIYNRIAEMGYDFASYISSKSSHWENLQTGKNVFVDEGCVLQPFIRISDNTILFTSQIGHHTRIGKHALISGSKTGGNVKIGDYCYLGLNASIKQNVEIAANTIIGMGCIIEKDILESSVFTHKGTTKRNLDPDQISRLFLK
ncbi:acetyltransferase [Salegentibacter flavus]|uniref:Sugar O-acyltransferase, sialic acid O-acetyltransferase NeuD family n=1 Tax=Salegentibacter flavus TaxID=287099 RepID=A0A1I5BGT3_9FLAO|nr:acetyltransferase [Salegentibacter flavus]SFN73925.1 sugar O-acyltransferase, sialic acid O-acetyltransferase NeuD family [Salegentibacter flavus]